MYLLLHPQASYACVGHAQDNFDNDKDEDDNTTCWRHDCFSTKADEVDDDNDDDEADEDKDVDINDNEVEQRSNDNDDDDDDDGSKRRLAEKRQSLSS